MPAADTLQAQGEAATPPPAPLPNTGSLSRRMIGIAAAWIFVLLLGGGLALDRILTNTITTSFDDQLEYVLTAMISSAEIGPDGEVFFNRPPGDQRNGLVGHLLLCLSGARVRQ